MLGGNCIWHGWWDDAGGGVLKILVASRQWVGWQPVAAVLPLLLFQQLFENLLAAIFLYAADGPNKFCVKVPKIMQILCKFQAFLQKNSFFFYLLDYKCSKNGFGVKIGVIDSEESEFDVRFDFDFSLYAVWEYYL